MINTPWHAKIDAQELFYFMILPVGENLIDPAVSVKTRLELCTDAHVTLIFNNYDECSPKEPWENPSCGGGVPLVTTWNCRCYCFAEKWSWKPKPKCELSALVSSRSLDERTAAESQINGFYLTSWCRHHNTLLVSKSCIRRTRCHQDALWRYGFFSAYSCTLQN